MNAAQVIGSWWVNFSRSLVGQILLVVFFVLRLGERNNERSERQLTVAAQRRTRGVGRAGALGGRKTGMAGRAFASPVGDGETEPIERGSIGGLLGNFIHYCFTTIKWIMFSVFSKPSLNAASS